MFQPNRWSLTRSPPPAHGHRHPPLTTPYCRQSLGPPYRSDLRRSQPVLPQTVTRSRSPSTSWTGWFPERTPLAVTGPDEIKPQYRKTGLAGLPAEPGEHPVSTHLVACEAVRHHDRRRRQGTIRNMEDAKTLLAPAHKFNLSLLHLLTPLEK